MRQTGHEIERWHRNQFGAIDDRIVGCKLGEEAGEVQGALIKIAEQRAFADELFDEIGDVLIVLTVLAERRGWDLTEIRRERFDYVSRRPAR